MHGPTCFRAPWPVRRSWPVCRSPTWSHCWWKDSVWHSTLKLTQCKEPRQPVFYWSVPICRLDLGQRDLSAAKGGLCGLAALQHALASTVATWWELSNAEVETQLFRFIIIMSSLSLCLFFSTFQIRELTKIIFFRSLLRTLDYELMKNMMIKEIGKKGNDSFTKLSDEDLLSEFHECNFLPIFPHTSLLQGPVDQSAGRRGRLPVSSSAVTRENQERQMNSCPGAHTAPDWGTSVV